MRAIKFRAWDSASKTMHHDVSPWRWDFVISNVWHRCEASTGPGILGSGGATAEMLVPAVRFTNLMQFTGLKDRNGVEIYEGDIIRYVDTHTAIPSEDCSPIVVEWNNVDAAWYGGLWRLGGLIDYAKCTVIGNIYENPELLEVPS